MEQLGGRSAEWMENLLASLDGQDVQYRLIFSVGWILVLVFSRWLLMRTVAKRSHDARLIYHARKISAYLAATLAVAVLVYLWFPAFQNLGTFLGLLSAGLAIALRDLITSLAGWIYILWQRPFEVGDRIQIGEEAGDVIDQGIIRFSLNEIGNWVQADQSTGRVIHIPNSRVFSENIANYTYGFHYIWNELAVRLTFESNWVKAKKLLQEIAETHVQKMSAEAGLSIREAARKAMILYSALTPRVWTEIGEYGVILTIRYLCPPRQRRGSAEVLWEAILAEFSKHDDISYAYPTRRYVNLEAIDFIRAPDVKPGGPSET